MPKFNADQETAMVEPIEVTLDGKDYVINKITYDMVKKVSAIGKRLEAGEVDAGTAVVQQAAVILNEDEELLGKTDIRKLSKVISFITGTVYGGEDDEKN